MVLAARHAGKLREAEQECAALGGQALAVPTDVGREDQVEALADHALEAFGRIDVWVNSAAVLLLGKVEDMPTAIHEQVIQTNLFGYFYGTRIAVRHFRRQGNGVLINIVSVLGAFAVPYASAYCATKWGIRGITESVRTEVLDAPDIHVCAILPSAINTPIFGNAANYSGRAARAPEPVYSADRVASAIVGLAQRPRRGVVVGRAGQLGMLGHTIWQALTERVTAAFIARRQFSERPAAPSPGKSL